MKNDLSSRLDPFARYLRCLSVVVAIAVCTPEARGQEDEAPSALRPVRLQDVELTSSFWRARLDTIRAVTLPALDQGFQEHGYLANFEVAAGRAEGKIVGALTNDADVYKWIEAASYALEHRADEALEARIDAIIEVIAAAQQEDGYLHTAHAFDKPDDRWKNIRGEYELFCAGHLIDAAIAHWQATGKRSLFDVAIRLADHVDSVFGPKARHDRPGHPGIELALTRLARVTGQDKYRELAEFFLMQRGDPRRSGRYGAFAQDEKPLLEERFIKGHAVRATYLYAGLAELALATDPAEFLGPLISIGHDAMRRHTYVTGGLGHTSPDKGFEDAYELPNDTALCETCAAVGSVLWYHRMALLTRHATYADAMERALYNNLMAGISPEGDRFAYSNPLAAGKSLARSEWPNPSCCPPNAARALSSISERIYAHDDRSVYLLMYAESETEITLEGGKVRIAQETKYPLEGKTLIRIDPRVTAFFTLHVRIPGWCEEFTLGVNDALSKVSMTHGSDPGMWYTLERAWKPGDVVTIDMPMKVKRMKAHSKVVADVNRVALQRGPLVYAFEALDNENSLVNLYLPPDGKIKAIFNPVLLGGTHVVRAKGRAVHIEAGVRTEVPRDLVGIPYYLWNCRVPSPMQVWIPELSELCTPLQK